MPDAEDLVYRLIGEKIRRARESASPRLSQGKLAERLGMSRASIVNIEAGRQRPPVHVLWAIAHELNVEAHQFIPLRSEYQQAVEPMKLDEDAIAQIEAVANGDPGTKRSLIEFISRAKNQLRTE